jgi:DNA-binding NtrC family response regulator
MNPKILVLDDQVQYGRSLDRALRHEYELVLATTLAEAKKKFAPDIGGVLADVRLDESIQNDRQGLEFVNYARSLRPDIPIISMSAIDDEFLEADALKAGATKFLRKPIVISQLKMLLAEMFQLKNNQ